MKPKILYVAGIAGFMEPTNGGQIRTHEILKQLCTRFEVDIFSPFVPNQLVGCGIQIQNNICNQPLKRLNRWQRRRGFSRLIISFRQRIAKKSGHHLKNGALLERQTLERLIQNNHQQYSHIFFDTSLYAPLSPSSEVRAKSILIAHNVDSVLQPNSQFHHRFEASLHNLFQTVIACTEQDAERFLSKTPKVTCIVWPNGTSQPQHVTCKEFKYDVLFVGALNYKPNIEAAHFLVKEAWPWLKSKGITLCIAGREPSTELYTSIQSAGITLIPNAPDLSVIYSQSKVAVVPLVTGSGSRLKIAEALINGLPVVSTALGAEGYPEHQIGLKIQECSPIEGFIQAIENELQTQSKKSRDEISKAATPFLWDNTIDLSKLPS